MVNDIFVERDVANAITRIRDYAGRTVDYAYDGSSNLTKVQDACGSCTSIPTAEYAYDGSHRIITIKDANGATIRTIAYDGSNRDYHRRERGVFTLSTLARPTWSSIPTITPPSTL